MLYYVNWVVQKPFAVIVFLTDNFNASALTAARIYGGGADNRLSVERFPVLSVVSNHAGDFAVSDVASASTAIATGRKVNNRNLGQDSSGQPLITLADIARERGRAVGLVTNASVTDAGAAAYYAKTNEPHDSAGLALQLMKAPGFDVLLGGGAMDFVPEHKGGKRADGRDLTMELRQSGFDVVRSKSELLNTPLWRAPKLIGFFAEGNLAFADEVAQAAAQPSLAEMVGQAIQLLQFNRKGYLLIVDAGLVGKAASQNEGERMLREFLQLDNAVATALAYAGKESLIVVAGRSSVGGLRLNGYPFRNDKGVAIVGINAQGLPSLTWSSGPGSGAGSGDDAKPVEPSAVPAPVAAGVAEDGLAVAVGPGSETLNSFSDNTDLFRLISSGL
jgi:alkaline phosphatase